MKFKNPTDQAQNFPTLNITIGAGEIYTAKDEKEAEALRRNPVVEEVAHSKSEAKRQRVMHNEPVEEPKED